MPNEQNDMQSQQRFQQKVTGNEELNARVDAAAREIKAGKRRPQRGQFSYETGEPIKKSFLRRVARGMTIGVIETLFKFIANIIRRVSDKLTGGSSFEDTKNAKRTIDALNEVSDEETEKLRQLHRDRQQLLAEQHLQQSRMMEDKARAVTNSLMDEGTKPKAPIGEAGAGTASKRTLGIGGPAQKSASDEILTSGLTSPADEGREQAVMAMLKDAHREYRETINQPVEQVLDAVYKDIEEKKPGQDSRTAIIKTIHRIYCFLDTKLHGDNALEGPNALTRVGVNQVMAYEAFIDLTNKIKTEPNPRLYMENLLASVRDDSGYENELMTHTLSFMENTKKQQETLYRVAASPLNRKEDLDWAWLVQACENASASASGAVKELNKALKGTEPAAPNIQMLSSPTIDTNLKSGPSPQEEVEAGTGVTIGKEQPKAPTENVEQEGAPQEPRAADYTL